VPIIAALRDAWLVNGQVTSFAQLMGLPQEQLSDTYYFPTYNNVSLSGQLRIGNVDNITTTVTVTIGGVVQGTYELDPNESVRPTYALDEGPVEVKSNYRTLTTSRRTTMSPSMASSALACRRRRYLMPSALVKEYLVRGFIRVCIQYMQNMQI
jgi:hypothetical protein